MTRLRGIAVGTVAVCLFASGAWADPAAQGTESESSQTLIPKVCPADPGTLPTAQGSPIKSQPILIPAQKPSIAIPCNADVVVTPDSSSSKKQRKTSVPAVTPAPIPDAIKKPITLEEALQIAFENSPNIQAALSEVEQSRGVVNEARARFNPTFNLQGATTRQGPVTTTEYPGGGAVQTISPTSTVTKLQVVLPLDISRQLKYSSDISKYQFQIQYLSMVSVSEQLIVDVKNAYYDLLRACARETVAQAAVDDAKATLDNITAKREEGTVPRFDQTSAEVELENLNQQLIAAKNQVSIAQSTLNGIMGVDVNNPTQVISSDVAVTADSINIPESVDQAYANRPELKAAQTAVTLSKTNVSLQKAGLLPTLSLNGGPSYNFNPSGLSPQHYTWQASATVNIPIWDGGISKSRVRQARAGVQNSVASLDQAKIAVAREVRRAALNLQEAALRTRTTAHAVSLAEDAFGIAKDRYDAGIAVLVEVTNAQTQLTQARFNYVNAQYDYAIALAQLQKAVSCQPELNQLQLLADEGTGEQNSKEARS